MELIELTKIFKKFWEHKGWQCPSNEWGTKLTLLLRDSLVLLNDAIDQSEPFFLLPSIQKEGLNFLQNKESRQSLRLIINTLTKENNTKINSYLAKEIINKISKEHSIKKGVLMKSLRVAFFGCLSGPDLTQSWELLSENNSDLLRIKRCLDSD